MSLDTDPALETETEIPTGEDESAESATTDGPQSGEESAEKGTSEESAEVSGELESAQHELVLPGEEEDGTEEEPPSGSAKDNVAWTRMRKAQAAEKAAQARIAELERKLQSAGQLTSPEDDPGPKPTLEALGWDEDAKDKALLEWHEKVRRIEERKTKVMAEAKTRAAKIQTAYVTAKADWAPQVGTKAYETAEQAVASALGPDAQDTLMKVAKNSAMVVYALGTRPALLEEFAKETDRDMFVARLKDMEAGIKVKKKSGTPPPLDKRINGAASGSGSTLEKLRAEAAKTGDNSKVDEYNRKQRRAQEDRERAQRK